MPEPLIEIAIEPKTKADQEKMRMALLRLAQGDPSFRVTRGLESGQTMHEAQTAARDGAAHGP